MRNEKSDLAKLLSANRKLTLICGVQALVLATFLVSGWSQKNELSLQRLSIVDSHGRERVVLRGGDDGPGLVLVDSNGAVRCGLTVDHDLPGLRMYNSQNQARLGLVLNPTGPNLDFLRDDGSYIDRFPKPTGLR